ncbi:MAG: tRNA nucleotidyltransferase [Bacteroidetes bacterium 4572_112]|nr:MAG: tRNA nucleotidyltransferase [Bacteroidetes bacterium 4572_112]
MKLEDNIEDVLKRKYIRQIVKSAEELDIRVFIIGGWVRDMLLHRESTDMDFVVEGSGIALAENLSQRLKAKLTVFKNFGTAMVKFNDNDDSIELEFVGARKESYRRNSRKPIIEDGSLQDDQDRRDFTINAMAIELKSEQTDSIIDPFGGLDDLDNRIIKTPLDPDITFSDDPLRMLRAIRFASQLNFTIEEETFKALERNKDRLEIISTERITSELNKIILSPEPSYGFNLLDETGILDIIFPELVALKGVKTIEGKSHKDNFYHTLEVLDNISLHTNNLYLRWAAILHDIGKASTKRFVKGFGWTFHGHEFIGSKMVPDIFNRMKLPMNEKMRFVQNLVRLHLRPISLIENHVTDSAIRRLLFEASNDIEALMTLCHADITSKNERKVKKFHRNFELVQIKLIELEEKDKLRNWQPPIDGDEIMKTFNLTPCRAIGDIKNTIREAILDGKIDNNYEAAHQLMIEEGKKLGFVVND